MGGAEWLNERNERAKSAWSGNPEERADAERRKREAEEALFGAEVQFTSAFIRLQADGDPGVTGGREYYLKNLLTDFLDRAWRQGPTGELGTRIIGELRELGKDAARNREPPVEG